MNTLTITKSEKFAVWLTETSTGSAVLWLMERMAFMFGALLAVWAVHTAETHFMPVITGWQLDHITKQDDKITASGVMFKARACEMVSTTVLAVPKAPLAPRRLIMRLRPDDISGGDVPVGFTTWGPWTITLVTPVHVDRDDLAALEVVTQHKCHAWWNQETVIGRIPVEKLP